MRKGRFTIFINVICVGIRSGLPKRRYRVVVDYVRDLLRHRDKAGCSGCFVEYDACVNLGKHRVVCGFSWLLRVIDHEAVLMDPKLFSSWVHRLVVLLKRRFGRQTSSRWRFSQKNDWIVQVIPQQAIKAIPVLSTRKMVIRRQKLGWHFLLRR